MVYLNLKYSELNNKIKIEATVNVKNIIFIFFEMCSKKNINKKIPKKAFMVLDRSPVKNIAIKKIKDNIRNKFFFLDSIHLQKNQLKLNKNH